MTNRPHIIVDGYNYILRQYCIDFSQEHALWDAREELIHRMVSYLGQKRTKITIVFDGQDVQGIAQKSRPAGISIVFSKAPRKADPVILDIIAKSKNKKNITLVTSDRPLARLAVGLGCDAVSVEAFSEKIAHKQKEQVQEYSQKFKGELSPKEVEEWLRLFKGGKED